MLPSHLQHLTRLCACLVALCSICLPLPSASASAQAFVGPLIAVRPEGIAGFEVPYGQWVRGWLTIYNLDPAGGRPLEWTINDVVPGTENDCPWLRESPTSGTVAPADSQTVGFEIPPGLRGLNSADFRIDSNDPVRPRVIVPLSFFVVVPTSARRHTFGELKARFRSPAGW